MRVLLTGARAPVTLDLARHFRRAGHEVFLADSVRLPVARPTRAVRRTFRVTRPVTNPARFVDDLVAIVRRWKIDVLVPTCEEIFFIAARLEAFSDCARVFAEPLARLATLHNKWEFARQVAVLDGPAEAPETRLLASDDDLRPWRHDHQAADWVFKPAYSRFAARTVIGPTNGELAAVRPHASDPWLAQRRIRGQEYSTYGVAQAGRLRAHSCYRSIYRAGQASGIYFVPHDEPRIQSFVKLFVQWYGFTGQIGFDFIVAENGQLYVLECNPRATSGLHLFTAEPVADAFLESAGPLLVPASSVPAMLGAVMPLYALPQALRSGAVWALFRDLLRARDVAFAWDDPLPALLAPLSLAEVILRACRTGQPLTRAATFDNEWNGEPL